jgi:hypothetical protein
MDGKAFYKYSKPAIAMGVKIYPKPSNSQRYKVIISRNGNEKIGDEIYLEEPYYKKVEKKTRTGVVTVKVLVPSIWDKILELYIDVCIKNNLL